MKQTVYLDYAAATPLRKEVLEAMLPLFNENFYNPSAGYAAAQAVRVELESARAKVAKVMGVRSTELVFTAGGTEANNLAINGIMSQFPDAKVLVSSIEHDSVLAPASTFSNELIPVDDKGMIDVSKLESLVSEDVVLVSIGYVNNEVGTIQPLKEISAMIHELRLRRKQSGNALPLLLHTDACQAGNYLPLLAHQVGVDLMTINGGKLYGPKQSGALFVKAGIALQPLIRGGGQERGLRSGTENVAQAIGLARALELAQAERTAAAKKTEALREQFIELLESHIPQVIINGHRKFRVANNVHITIPGTDNERIMIALDELGVQCAVGSACSASSDEPSHVLRAMGMSEDHARGSLRFTIGQNTTLRSLEYATKLLASLL